MVFGLLACVLLVGVLWTVIGVGEMTSFRERAQDARLVHAGGAGAAKHQRCADSRGIRRVSHA